MPPETLHEMLAAARRRTRSGGASEATEADGTSAYVAAIRGVPAGLVAAVETCFGLLLDNDQCLEWIDDRFVRVGEICDVWGRLHRLVGHLLDERGSYVKADVVARADDAALCELISQSCTRVAGAAATQEAFLAAYRRFESELDVERMGALRRSLGRSTDAGPAGATAFDELVSVARDQHFVLPAEKRLWARPAQ
jgi:hypothetical protein